MIGDDQRRRALGICLVAAFMSGLDVSIVNVALPSIRDGLHASAGGLQWIVSGYALTFGLLLIPAGRLGDARGRKTVFLAGVALFTLASATCGLATNMPLLIVSRLVQGIGAGLINPQVSGLIQQMFQGGGRGRAFGALGAAIGLSTAVGPLVGGGLVTAFGHEEGWRWVFLVNLPIGIVLLPLAWKVLPAPETAGRRESLDPVGVSLLGLGVTGLLLPFIQAQQWPGGAKWLLIPASLAVLAGFVAWERAYRREPLIDLSLFRLRTYSLGTIIAMLYFAGFTGIFFIFTLYLQNGRDYSALLAGLAITPFALGSASASVVGGRLVTRMGRLLVAIGLATVVVGLALTMFATELVPGRDVGVATALPLLLAGIGSGLVISPNQAIALSQVPPAGGGSAAGVLQTGQRLGSSIGIAVVGSTFFGSLGQGWATGFRHGLMVVLMFVAIALAAALYDLILERVQRTRCRT
ncbi:MFS transporter [Nonomuraea cavernae]|uniref:MFS transporter n=1 Tax=Nonomuraea cavernae TaxID=2045107 RepID=A0A917YZA6_9ACTN|nr:MFS transporter [Nonomuraea cavernae]MCA2187417.1 MFS transporter [Nonomuraea cavernae]GGO68562.1 MFS transporter [Nonomuraea cavernae]